ncbi:glycosyltransferase family 9 protein [Algisphaera agarilytica]|uniref:Lipopolysaccharide heptosyltransferase I n=1 Tax=Algisphaera agarilytica TaxID=1385975 RepID=A0A7X0H553_9BACT|nr:glycosyltransferase family 9 protein [Algisphaera agarilytica]MBB6429477.1 lipopolysaccharide heptosyltransferase I [Algisphaera agarilytica]
MQRILIIRPSALGDVARTVPCLASLRRAYPEARIDWLVGSAFVDAVRAHPGLTGVIPFDRKKRSAVWPMLRTLRQTRYDMAIDLQGLARSGFFAWASRAKQRVGYANARELGWLGYTDKHLIDEKLHAADRMLRLIDALDVPRVNDLSLHVPDEDQQWLDQHLAELGVSPGRYACVAPTAQWGCKCWPMQRYAEVTQRLLEQPDIDHVFVLAAPHEQARVQAGFTALSPEELERTATPPTTVGKLMAVLAGAKLLVCNDSAPLHLAVGLATPTVSLFGPTDPALVGPPPPGFFTPPLGDASAVPLPEGSSGQRVADLITTGRHRVLRAPSAVGRTFNYRAHRDDDTLISELTVDEAWSAIDQALQP